MFTRKFYTICTGILFFTAALGVAILLKNLLHKTIELNITEIKLKESYRRSRFMVDTTKEVVQQNDLVLMENKKLREELWLWENTRARQTAKNLKALKKQIAIRNKKHFNKKKKLMASFGIGGPE